MDESHRATKALSTPRRGRRHAGQEEHGHLTVAGLKGASPMLRADIRVVPQLVDAGRACALGTTRPSACVAQGERPTPASR